MVKEEEREGKKDDNDDQEHDNVDDTVFFKKRTGLMCTDIWYYIEGWYLNHDIKFSHAICLKINKYVTVQLFGVTKYDSTYHDFVRALYYQIALLWLQKSLDGSYFDIINSLLSFL